MTVRSIAIYSDVICPWCFVGKRRLERALDQVGRRDGIEIAWLPFELNPDMPEAGMERSLYRARKFGAERSAMFDAQLAELGKAEGISFAFDRIQRTPNTRRAHTLIAHASESGLVDALVELLFRAYFEQGRDIGDDEVLVELAAQAGLSSAEAREALGNPATRGFVVETEREAAQLGVGGVPFFVIDGARAVSGAQPAEDWVRVLEESPSRGNVAAE